MPASSETATGFAPPVPGTAPAKSGDINVGDVQDFVFAALERKPDIESWANQRLAFARARIDLSIRLCRQALRYRGILFYFLLLLMAVETIFLFIIVLATAKPDPKLIIGDTTLQIIVGATIIQISTMVVVIIQSVFPKEMKQLIDVSKEIAYLKVK